MRRLPPHEKRHHALYVRFTEDEYEELTKLAKGKGFQRLSEMVYHSCKKLLRDTGKKAFAWPSGLSFNLLKKRGPEKKSLTSEDEPTR